MTRFIRSARCGAAISWLLRLLGGTLKKTRATACWSPLAGHFFGSRSQKPSGKSRTRRKAGLAQRSDVAPAAYDVTDGG